MLFSWRLILASGEFEVTKFCLHKMFCAKSKPGGFSVAAMVFWANQQSKFVELVCLTHTNRCEQCKANKRDISTRSECENFRTYLCRLVQVTLWIQPVSKLLVKSFLYNPILRLDTHRFVIWGRRRLKLCQLESANCTLLHSKWIFCTAVRKRRGLSIKNPF